MKRPSFFSFLVVALLLASAHISVLSKFVFTHEPIDGQFYEYHNPWQLYSAFDNAVAQPVYTLSDSPLHFIPSAFRCCSQPSL